MSATRETAYAKLNLALHVREKMADGYHRIETIFAFCEDGDQLSAQPFEHVWVDVSGPMAAGLPDGDSLIGAAADLLMQKRREQGAVFLDGGACISLTKVLPVASGLGGGSADAAAALRLLNRMWGVGLNEQELEALGRELGADVGPCILSQPAFGRGRGDDLQPLDLGLGGTPVLLVNPRVALPTAQVFGAWDGVDRGPLDDWQHGRNDLTDAAIKLAPQVGGILAWLAAQPGAVFIRMSGSGATCFAFFDSDESRDRAAEAVPREWWHLATRLR